MRLSDLSTQLPIRKSAFITFLKNYSGSTAMIFGEVSKSDGEWKFDAIGSGHL